LLLMANIFLLLTCYYILKPLREALLDSAAIRSYSSAGQAVLFMFLVPFYTGLASRVPRLQLVTRVTLFFIVNLLVFYVLVLLKVPNIGVPFFIWLGVFNMAVVAQFWSFANDLYTPEQGKRLLVIVGFGANIGAVLGSALTEWLMKPLGLNTLFLVAAALLAVCLFLFHATQRRDTQERLAAGATTRAAAGGAPLAKGGAWALVFSDRYFVLIGLLVIVANFVNSNGEFLLRQAAENAAGALVDAGQTNGMAAHDFKAQFIGLFYAGYQKWTSILTVLIQMFVVSRVFQWFGVRAALFVLPLVAMGGYGLVSVFPALAAFRLLKIAENATDYSLQKTASQALFLPTSREAKYKVKAVLDTILVRLGDVLAAGLVFLATQYAAVGANLGWINVALAAVWVAIVVALGRRHRELVGGDTAAS
ncbi:MAG: hypothetical protein ABL977_02140, partial [Candidatus Eisenbacteria bacterium]